MKTRSTKLSTNDPTPYQLACEREAPDPGESIAITGRAQQVWAAKSARSMRNMVFQQPYNLAIYCDMDGVIADYDGGIRAMGFDIDPKIKNDLNRSNTKNPLKRAMNERIRGTNFYRQLPLMPEALKLWEGIADLDPIIVTASPKFGATEDNYYLNPYWLGAAYHKRGWMEEVFLPQTLGMDTRVPLPDDRFICTTSARKSEFMYRKRAPHQVLIDDRKSNCLDWAAAGGYAILYNGNAEEALDHLSALCSREDFFSHVAGVAGLNGVGT